MYMHAHIYIHIYKTVCDREIHCPQNGGRRIPERDPLGAPKKGAPRPEMNPKHL